MPKVGKLPSNHIKSDHHQPTSETPFKWRFAGGPIVARHCMLTGKGPYNSHSTRLMRVFSEWISHIYTNSQELDAHAQPHCWYSKVRLLRTQGILGHTFANSGNPDETAPYEPSHQDLHGLLR